MKLIRELRHRQTWEQPKSSNPLPIIFGALIAFGLGVLGVSGVIKAPQFVLVQPRVVQTAAAATDAPAPQAKAILPGLRRNGRAENASLLPLCVPLHRLGLEPSPQGVEPGELYRLLNTATGMRVVTLAGLKPQGHETMEAAILWGEVADCIYKQNGWRLCDTDNRALAAEAANSFVRQMNVASHAGKSHDPLARNAERAYRMQAAEATRTRVMANLRQHVAEGRLRASDFGMFAPAEVLQAVRETRVMRNSCEERG